MIARATPGTTTAPASYHIYRVSQRKGTNRILLEPYGAQGHQAFPGRVHKFGPTVLSFGQYFFLLVKIFLGNALVDETTFIKNAIYALQAL